MASPAAGSEAAAAVTTQFRRGGLRVTVVVTFGWHCLSTLPLVIIIWAKHGPVAAGAPVWAEYTILGIVSSVAVLGDNPAWHRPFLPWAVCVLLLAGAFTNELTLSGGFFAVPSFGFSSVAWFALVALWHRRLAELLAFFAANAVVGVVALALWHETSRPHAAMFLVFWAGGSVFQATIYLGTRLVAETAGRAADAEAAVAQERTASLAADAVQTDRRARHELIGAAVAPLLARLAAGDLDFTSAPGRQEIAVAVTRLRRYLVESDDVPDPLSHELRACADAAERRGVAVDLMATAGAIPLLGVATRRALVEPVIQVLAAAVSRVRITVIASATDVVVAVVADTSAALAFTEPADDSVCWEWDEEGGWVWAQASWTRLSGSPW